MKTSRAENVRIKRHYFEYLSEAKRNGERTVDVAAAALDRFEAQTKGKSFRAFRQEQAVAFKRHLDGLVNAGVIPGQRSGAKPGQWVRHGDMERAPIGALSMSP